MAAPKAKLGSTWMDVHGIRQALTKSRSNREAQKKLLSTLQDKLGQRHSEIESSLSGLDQRSQNLTAQAVSGYRNELRAESASARLAFVQEAGKLRQELQSASAFYQSSPQMLARYTLGSERRSRLMEQIALSGPAELASLAELAASTNDKELAAALCSRAYDIEPGKRPFDATELADAILGDEFREIQVAIAEIDRIAIEAVNDDTAFETGKRNPGRDLHLAMLQKRESGEREAVST